MTLNFLHNAILHLKGLLNANFVAEDPDPDPLPQKMRNCADSEPQHCLIRISVLYMKKI
jgi:hypothetical protein